MTQKSWPLGLKKMLKVVTWILNSSDPSLVVALQTYTTAADMWAHLKKVYHQTNKARKFHLDSEIAKYTQRGKISVGIF